MIEAMVMALCLGQYRCDIASKAYLSNNPPPKAWLKAKTKNLEEYTGKQTIIGLTIVSAIATNHPYQVRLNRYFSIGKNETAVILLYAVEF